MNDKIKKHQIMAEVDSAGFESFHMGDHPDYRAIKVMADHGIDISKHRMRLFREADFDHFDRIYVMDRYNYQDVISMARSETDNSKVDYILNVLEPGSENPVPDPYYGGIMGFEKVYDLLNQATERIALELKKMKC